MACSCPELVQMLRRAEMDLFNPDFRWKALTKIIHLSHEKDEFRRVYQIVFLTYCVGDEDQMKMKICRLGVHTSPAPSLEKRVNTNKRDKTRQDKHESVDTDAGPHTHMLH